MSFINDCCRAWFTAAGDTATTGDEFTCATCQNQFIYDGEKWRNVLDIGSRKAEKFRKIRRVETLVARLPVSADDLPF